MAKFGIPFDAELIVSAENEEQAEAKALEILDFLTDLHISGIVRYESED